MKNICLLLLALAGPAGAVPLFDSLSDGLYDYWSYGVLGPDHWTGWGPVRGGFSFSPVRDARLGSIAGAWTKTYLGPGPSFRVQLARDELGLPGPVMETWEGLIPNSVFWNDSIVPVELPSAGFPDLLASERYWLIAETFGDDEMTWNASLVSRGPMAWEHQGEWKTNGGEDYLGGFRVEEAGPGDPVPEPQVTVLLALSLIVAGIGAMRRPVHDWRASL